MEDKTINALRWILEILHRNEVEYQITGGLAAKIYGSPRPLNDIDIDLSGKSFPTIVPEISEYITFGPARFKDGKWDMDMISLNYQGQEMDLSGIDNDPRISNKPRTEWIPYLSDISKKLKLDHEGMDVWVMHPRALAAYKKELDGDHQSMDIAAAEKYASEHGS
ncbi:MAG: hypothetical protein G01um10148_803 [Parcubacteria group bacterium Gr01-1014_8]|nr:MAG: hypothetical protein G01um10148_803 [Parcubacteria group bacterium Gr01-1014_8]